MRFIEVYVEGSMSGHYVRELSLKESTIFSAENETAKYKDCERREIVMFMSECVYGLARLEL